MDRRPTRAGVRLLTRSRVELTSALAVAAAAGAPSVWVQMSTLAIYGDAGDRILDEGAPPADGPSRMAGVARAGSRPRWARPPAVRSSCAPASCWTATPRPLDRLVGLVRWGGVGSGRQWVSWLHVDDFLAIVRRALDDPALSGIVHATSPVPVRNAS